MKRHVPIMAKEIFAMIPEQAKIIVDGTLGHGGHTQFFVENGNPDRRYIGVDVDPQLLAQAKDYLKESLGDKSDDIRFVNKSYAQLDEVLGEMWIQSVDFILLDLGINREHVLNAERGFSINKDGPLDMRFSPERQSAYDLLQSCTQAQLETWFVQYGDIKPHHAKGYAQYILQNKADPRIKTTLGFRDIMRSIRVNDKVLAVIFQVLRIVVNKELEHVELFIKKLPSFLSKGWRCAVITFHSIEDRLVKYAFKDLVETGSCELVNKKVIIPHYLEVKKNKASRSAKLRVIEKI